MRIVAVFDPATNTTDTFNAGFPNGTGKMVVFNESNINLQLGWGSFSAYLPAWTAMVYCVSTNNVNISWQQQSILATVGSPLSQVLVEAYDPGEAIIGTFPAPLVRQTNIGNNTPLSTSATSVTNDGNVANTRFIEATVAGDASSAVSLKNDGTLVLGNATHTGSISSDNGAFTTDGLGDISTHDVTVASGHKITTPEVDSPAATDLVENVPTGKAIRWKVNAVEQAHLTTTGLIVVPGKLGQTADGDIIDAGSTNTTYVKARTGGPGSINFQVPNGSTVASITDNQTGAASIVNTGSLTVGKVFFNIGSIKDFVTGASLAGTVNHGLSGTPAAVMATCNSSPSTQTTGADTYTSTQFTMRSGAALSNEWIAMR